MPCNYPIACSQGAAGRAPAKRGLRVGDGNVAANRPETEIKRNLQTTKGDIRKRDETNWEAAIELQIRGIRSLKFCQNSAEEPRLY